VTAGDVTLVAFQVSELMPLLETTSGEQIASLKLKSEKKLKHLNRLFKQRI